MRGNAPRVNDLPQLHVGSMAALRAAMQPISIEALEHVVGGAMQSASTPTAGYSPEPANLSSKLGMGGGPVGAPGGQVFENNHSGPSALQRVNNAFDNSTKVMRTFNDTFGFATQAPGFGRGDVMAP